MRHTLILKRINGDPSDTCTASENGEVCLKVPDQDFTSLLAGELPKVIQSLQRVPHDVKDIVLELHECEENPEFAEIVLEHIVRCVGDEEVVQLRLLNFGFMELNMIGKAKSLVTSLHARLYDLGHDDTKSINEALAGLSNLQHLTLNVDDRLPPETLADILGSVRSSHLRTITIPGWTYSLRNLVPCLETVTPLDIVVDDRIDAVRDLQVLPQEIYDRILGYMPIGASKLNRDIGRSSNASTQSRYSSIWESVFATDDWLNMVCAEAKVNPLLLGNRQDFEQVINSPNAEKLKAYFILILKDWSGDTRYTRKELLESLRIGKLCGCSFLFRSGITLDLHDVLLGCDDTILYTSKLFQNSSDLSYVFWKDSQASVRNLGKDQLAVPRSIPDLQRPMLWNEIAQNRPFGRITTDNEPLCKDWTNANHPKDSNDMSVGFGLRLNLPNGQPFNQRFEPAKSELHAFWRRRIIDWREDSLKKVMELHSHALEDSFEGFQYAEGQAVVSRLES